MFKRIASKSQSESLKKHKLRANGRLSHHKFSSFFKKNTNFNGPDRRTVVQIQLTIN